MLARDPLSLSSVGIDRLVARRIWGKVERNLNSAKNDAVLHLVRAKAAPDLLLQNCHVLCSKWGYLTGRSLNTCSFILGPSVSTHRHTKLFYLTCAVFHLRVGTHGGHNLLALSPRNQDASAVKTRVHVPGTSLRRCIFLRTKKQFFGHHVQPSPHLTLLEPQSRFGGKLLGI